MGIECNDFESFDLTKGFESRVLNYSNFSLTRRGYRFVISGNEIKLSYPCECNTTGFDVSHLLGETFSALSRSVQNEGANSHRESEIWFSPSGYHSLRRGACDEGRR